MYLNGWSSGGAVFSKMWLWVGLCFISALVAENTILATEATTTNYEEVLLKIWTIFADLLDTDGVTVNVPSRDHIQYALTLIKKSILNHEDRDNVDLIRRLFRREAELAKYKGLYLYDNRLLDTMLEQDLSRNKDSNVMFTYPLNTNIQPNCREAFRKLIQKTQEDYNSLANSYVCNGDSTGVQSHHNVWNAEYQNQILDLNTEVKDSTRNRHEKYITALSDSVSNFGSNQNLQTEFNNVPNTQESASNAANSNRLLHAVKLSKETNRLLGSDYTSDLEHAKGVADKMNKLYEASNAYSFTSQAPLRNLDTNFVSVSSGVVNDTPWVRTFYSKPAAVRASYMAQSQQNNNINQDRESTQENAYSYNAQTQGMPNNVVNQPYTLISNTAQAAGLKNIIIKPENTNPFNNFVNAKWHPNPAHYSEASKEELSSNTPTANKAHVPATVNIPKIIFNMHKHPYRNKYLQHIPQNSPTMPQPKQIAEFSDRLPPKSNVYQQPYMSKNQLDYYYNTFLNPYSWNYPHSAAYKPGQNQPYVFNYYNNKYYPVLRPNNGAYGNKFFQVSGENAHSMSTWQNYFKQNYQNVLSSQKTMQMTQAQAYGVNGLHKPLKSFAYNSKYVNYNVPFTQQTSYYYNDQGVIDKLANWISGTNSAKLDSNIHNEAEIELTYKVNKQPFNQPATFYVKFRMPYIQFAGHLKEFLALQNSRSASTDTDLYNNLASRYNATVIPTDNMSKVPEEEIRNPEDKLLVGARYIQPNESGNDSSNSVDIINFNGEAESKNADVLNTVDNVASDDLKAIQDVK